MEAKNGFKVESTDPLVISGSFRFGMKLKDKVEKDFAIREATTEDVLSAEADAHAGNTPLTYEVALASRQLVRVGTFEGPFTLSLVRERLSKPADLARLRAAQTELDRLLGEG